MAYFRIPAYTKPWKHPRELLAVLLQLALWSEIGVLTRLWLDLLVLNGCKGGWGFCLTSPGLTLTQLAHVTASSMHTYPIYSCSPLSLVPPPLSFLHLSPPRLSPYVCMRACLRGVCACARSAAKPMEWLRGFGFSPLTSRSDAQAFCRTGTAPILAICLPTPSAAL